MFIHVTTTISSRYGWALLDNLFNFKDLVSFRFPGNEEVIHLAGDENDGLNGNIKPSHAFTICGKSFNKAVVKRENVWKVVLDSKVEINNNKDRKCK